MWRPENYSGKFFGPTRLRKALSLSLNLVSVRILRAVGLQKTHEYLSRFGFDSNTLPQGLSLALGSGTVPPITVVRAYAVLANGGYRVEPYFIDWIEDSDGNVVEQARPQQVCRHCDAAANFVSELESNSPKIIKTVEADQIETKNEGVDESLFPSDQDILIDQNVSKKTIAERVISVESHFLITSMMQDIIRHGTGRRALTLGRNDLAGKTGTTNDFKDAWFSGFSRDVVTTVWVGFDDSRTLGKGEAGSKAALPIWVEYMEEGLKGVPEYELAQPDGVVSVRVSLESGEAVSEEDPGGYTEYFRVGTEPQYGGVFTTLAE